ncbi:peptide ABC transporter substrate-binding protein [Acrocarpospora pleiomorpha]|uniref:Peptide ABC transporter substrate-binding protein n=1 Tax=Acrocarpospora pleiomorpha TaxID=90975 RepID=A0A5M3X9A8_9ACTN|nr:ABC transporter substrate-binding protein [Acrocarpospora pleiomorpha]GES18317.1 peptide ABC transporter substrate-binding protein [Acrocarpospora pleiomorpha]
MKSRIAVGALALATLTACGNGPAAQEPASGKTFTLVLGADPGNLDPHFTSLASALQADRFLYDSLVNIDEHGKIVAGLADKWEATTTTATFTLRKGITCAGGAPLTAAQVAANINFVGDPKNASSRVGVYVPPGATAKGDDAAGTVTVTSPAPDPFLDRNVGSLQIVCGKGMADRGLLKQGADGTGMFTVTEAVTGDHYTLTRRPDYAWGPGDWKTDQPGLPDKVVLQIVANESTAANLLLSKAVNAVQLVGPDSQRVAATKAFERSTEAPLGELWFNQKAGFPGADEAVRRALTQAIDLSQLAQVVGSGRGKPATGLIIPGGPCGRNTIGSSLPAHDVNAAKAALDTADWTAGADGVRAKNGTKLSMALYYSTSLGPGMQAGAELVQTMWQGAGVDVTLRGVADAELGQQIVGGQAPWSAVILPLGISLPTQAVPFMSGPTPPDGTNFAGIDNADYTAAVKAASAVAGSSGCAQWDAAEQALFKGVDIVPFVNSNVSVFGQAATFELSQGSVTPGSIRMLG